MQELQFEETARVRGTLVHVIVQIAYKKNCLPVVVAHLKTWENRSLVADDFAEIIDVHRRYKNFAAQTAEKAERYITESFKLPV